MQDNTQNNINEQEEQEKQIHQSLANRVGCLLSIFILLALLIVVKVLSTQGGMTGEELRRMGSDHAYMPSIVESTRGDILSDDGRVMMTSIPYYDLRIDFAAPGLTDERFNKNIIGLSDSLSSFFGDKDSKAYQELLSAGRAKQHRYYRIAPRRVNYMELQRIAKFPLLREGILRSGFIAERVFERERPFGAISSRVLGFINEEGRKVGLEGYFDDVLCGVDGLVIKQKISGNFWIPISSELNIEPTDGLDVRSTIDIEMQDIAEEVLRQRVEDLNAKWGTVVVMDVATGDVKVMANFGRDEKGNIGQIYNYAVGTSLEPGSTFKLPVLVTLLENTGLTLGTIFDTGDGRRSYGRNATVTDSRRGGYGVQTLQGVFEHSSNIGMVEAVRRYYHHSPALFIDQLRATGMGQRLDLQLTGEPTPTIKDPRIKDSRHHNGGWDTTSLVRMSQGYAVRFTPLQTLTYFNAVAGGGRMVAPRLVTSLERKGEVVKEFPVRVLKEQIASPRVIADVQKALKGVVTNGTGKSLLNPLYTVAAKTGTAQVANGRWGYRQADGSMDYLGSMVGYFPADNPRYTMIVAFQTNYTPGSGNLYYGAAVASPVFREIADRLYTSSEIFMERHGGSSSELTPHRAPSPIKFTEDGVPLVTGYNLEEATDELERHGFTVRYSGYGHVTSQQLEANNTVILLLND